MLISYINAVAIDVSVAQNSLLELKIVAISHLEYEDYLMLLGEVVCDGQIRYNRLRNHVWILWHLPIRVYSLVKTTMEFDHKTTGL